MWVEHKNRLDMNIFSLNEKVSATVYNWLRHEVNWEVMISSRKVSDEFLLGINSFFESIPFSEQNPSAKKIKEKTWESLGRTNSEVFQVSDDKKEFIRKHVIPPDTILDYAMKKKWDSADWRIISRYHRVDWEVAKTLYNRLNTVELFCENKLHTLSAEETKQIIEFSSEHLKNQVKEGVEYRWGNLLEQVVVTPKFLEIIRSKLTEEEHKKAFNIFLSAMEIAMKKEREK